MSTMRAAVLNEPGPPSAFDIKDVPLPKPKAGQVLIKIKSFGLNRSEYHTRKGLAGSSVTWPRILGIEATGVVEEAPGGEYNKGQQICAIMGGMGRSIDGGYAEYTCVPASCCHPFKSTLPWSQLGAIPEALQTSAGSLETLDLKEGETLLIRGGTSSIGLFTASLASSRGITVFSTSGSNARADVLKKYGVTHVITDDGNVSEKVLQIIPEGVHGALELVGVNALKDTIRSTRYRATTCFTGMLSDQWTIKDFYPMDLLPNGRRLTAYGGGSTDMPQGALQNYIDAIQAGKAEVPIGKVFPKLEDVVAAHELMETGKASGKIVVLTGQ